MAREDDFVSRLEDEPLLMAILTGGIYSSGEVGPEGITRDTTPGAFAGGYLLPCALVRERSEIPDGVVRDLVEQRTSTSQIVEVWVYQDRGFDQIDAALAMIYTLMQGYAFADSFPVEWALTVNRLRDEGALSGASVARQDWQVFTIR